MTEIFELATVVKALGHFLTGELIEFLFRSGKKLTNKTFVSHDSINDSINDFDIK